MQIVIRQVIIRGRVQGVGFRFFVLRAARAAGLVGWVRNLPDGSVEALASGDAEALARLREALRRGPPAARVESVVEATESLEAEGSGFRIL